MRLFAVISPFFVIACCLVVLGTTATDCASEIIDKVVAQVNDDVITLSELEEEGGPLFAKIRREAPADERQEALEMVRDQVLNALVNRTLIAQEAAKQGITVSDQEVDEAFNQVLAANGATREEFLGELEQNGIGEQTYRRNLKSQLLQNKLLMLAVHSKILITDDMVLDYYHDEYTKNVDEGSFYLLQIGVGWDEPETAQQSTVELYQAKLDARKRAERIHKLALAGQDFRDLARRFSDLPSAEEGGDIGVFAEDEMADYMKMAVADLKPGEISDIVETPFGYQFFQLLSGGSGGIVSKAPYETVKEQIREKLYRETMQEEYEAWLKRLREAAYIRK
ncbi:MAG: SurA N-terminal domain-containing protein [Desulfofustis sp.]|jgi:peptidyl-prolyl cis-trans isomerase SurA|nr:SurA N-terminal domain-containing protein [Desulfofustis sp.]